MSSADLLLAYLRSRDDVTYIVLTDTLSGLLVRRGKGRPSKLQPIPENFASYSAHGKRDSLMLSDSQELLLAVGWVLDHELQLLSMFPEVFFMDVTCKTNKEGRGLFLVAGKDGNNCGFTAARIFLPSEQRWVFDWIFSTALPSLLSEEVIRKNKLCVTDGDPQMFEALRSQQAKREVWLGSHVFCEWHLLVVGWKVHVSCTVPFKTSRYNSLCCSSSMRMIRSPGMPPRSPAFPLPLTLSCMPSCTPAGMSMLTVSSPNTRPSPLQLPHLAVMVDPSPWQFGQVDTVCICPRKVFWTRRTCPLPPQVPQDCILPLSFAPLPLQVVQGTCFLTLMFLVTPLAISS